MKQMEFEVNGKQYHRVSKPMARKAYRDGKAVMVCPCKLRPGTPWHPEVTVDTVIDGNDFNKVVLWFETYNCNAVAGWYASFYVTE